MSNVLALTWPLADATGGFGELAPWINAGAAMACVGVGAYYIIKLPSLKRDEHAREMERQAARDTHDRELREWHDRQITEHSRQNAETRASVKELTTSIGDLVQEIAQIPCRMPHVRSLSPSQHSPQ